MWNVYIVNCKDGSYYTGIAEDVGERIKQHNIGKGSSYVVKRRPVHLVYMKEFETKSLARMREIEIKKLGVRNKEKLIFQYAINRPSFPMIR